MNQNNPGVNSDSEISIKDTIIKIRSGIKYLISKWVVILISLVFGAILGFYYSISKKPTYTAICNFVLEDAKSGGGLGQLAGLASLAGINIGGSPGGGNIFEGDNIIVLYKSRDMVEKALLGEVTIKGKKQMLIDRYINFNKLRKKWKKEDHIDSITFQGDPEQFSRRQDSIITDLVALFNKKILNIDKLDKKLSIISVKVTSEDEIFSKMFADKLVETVNNFYILTKTGKTYHSVKVLQKQADSLRLGFNSSLFGVASAIDADPNANPTMQTLRVPSQKKQIDVQSNAAMFTEIVKDLEIAKVTLREETPLIQVVDKPVYPLQVNGLPWTKGMLFGALFFTFIIIFYLIGKKILQSILS
jgi:hypothetical protein